MIGFSIILLDCRCSCSFKYPRSGSKGIYRTSKQLSNFCNKFESDFFLAFLDFYDKFDSISTILWWINPEISTLDFSKFNFSLRFFWNIFANGTKIYWNNGNINLKLFFLITRSLTLILSHSKIFIKMTFKKYKPVNASQRHLILVNKFFLKKVPLIKSKIVGILNSSGRNNQGKITVRHKGGGAQHKYRFINFKINLITTGIITSLEYDPHRTAFIASVYDFLNRRYFFMLAPKNLNIGDVVKSGFSAEVKIGHSLTLLKIPIGGFIHNISLRENRKAQFTRSAGTTAQLIEKTSKYCRVVLSSGIHKFIQPTCYATIGTVSNEFSFLKKINKAGRNRWLNRRPTVRGVAMNPVDHPHGGGEGKSSGGRSSVTPWGKPTKNGKTSRSQNLKF